jgi:hypothetical protein
MPRFETPYRLPHLARLCIRINAIPAPSNKAEITKNATS